MSTETKQCQNCKNNFTIEPDDFGFYEKIKVPVPTWCPECRMTRRMLWRNERNLYQQTCGLCQNAIVSIYSPDKQYTVLCQDCFNGDGWDPLAYSIDIDFSKPFLQQFKELQRAVPRLHAFVLKNENCAYVNGAAYNKNCYFIYVSDYNEDSMYSYRIMRCKTVFDCYDSTDCESCYDCISCIKCSRALFSEDCFNCKNIIASENCVNCEDCVGCIGLRNKRYHIFNQQYEKSSYNEKLKSLVLDSQVGIDAALDKVQEIAHRCPLKYYHGSGNRKVTGDYISNSKYSKLCFGSEHLQYCKNIHWGDHSKQCYDGYVVIENSSNSCELVSAIAVQNVKCSLMPWRCSDVAYVDTCENSNHLFGCVGLRNKQYCVLNKQYSRSDYETLVPQIIKHMNDMPYMDRGGRTYRYGEFFPPELADVCYNETVAQDYFPLERDQALASGYGWKKAEQYSYAIDFKESELPPRISKTDETIVGKVIGCKNAGQTQCDTAFSISEQEFQFFKKMNIPLPHLCPTCRHRSRIESRNPLKLWTRPCMCTNRHFHGENPCHEVFETPYEPGKKVIFCERCYEDII